VVVEGERASMHQLRHSTALRQLDDLEPAEIVPSQWSWAICRVEAQGRLRLPPAARAVLDVADGESTVVRAFVNRVALVLRREGNGAVLAVDGRGRLPLPVWLRHTAPGGLAVVGAQADPVCPVVVVGSTRILDGLGDVLVGEGR
jgi:hypothetical protein